MIRKINIAIDGHSACGKSTTAKALAQFLAYTYVDSGAMYRAVTLYFIEHKITLTNPKEVARALENISIEFRSNSESRSETYLNGVRVEEEIRSLKISGKVSEVSAISAVRRAMVAQQQKLSRKKGVVMDGRDIGSVVLPDAELKIFMTADINVRAERRQKEMMEKGHLVNFDEVKESLANRDRIDSTREDSPLVIAKDAEIVDTSMLTFEEQLSECISLATSKLATQLKLEDYGSTD